MIEEAEENQKVYKFLTMFDCEGFECIIDITRHEKLHTIAILKGEEYDTGFNLQAMMLRARFNAQRSPEIWVFESLVDLESLEELKEEDPQALADLIRSHGRAMWTSGKQNNVIK